MLCRNHLSLVMKCVHPPKGDPIPLPPAPICALPADLPVPDVHRRGIMPWAPPVSGFSHLARCSVSEAPPCRGGPPDFCPRHGGPPSPPCLVHGGAPPARAEHAAESTDPSRPFIPAPSGDSHPGAARRVPWLAALPPSARPAVSGGVLVVQPPLLSPHPHVCLPHPLTGLCAHWAHLDGQERLPLGGWGA